MMNFFHNGTGTGSTKRVMLTVRIDDRLKKQAEANLAQLGLTATDAVTQLYRFIAEHGRMPVTERIVTFDDAHEFTLDNDSAVMSAQGKAVFARSDVSQLRALSLDTDAQTLLQNTNVFFSHSADKVSTTFNPTDAIGMLAHRFVQSLRAENIRCCDALAFRTIVVEIFTINTLNPSAGEERQITALLAGTANITFWDAKGSLNAHGDDALSRRQRLSSLLQQHYGFSDDQAHTFITGIVDREHIDNAAREQDELTPRFLAFLAERDISCSDPEAFAECVKSNACSPHGSITRALQQAHGFGIHFRQEKQRVSPETSQLSLRFELRDALGFSDQEAIAIATQIQSAE
ncbi:TPA: type II toxin-antitoxin system RelB/DinJ family antitoxin [Yersinia enterocolitica]